MEIPIGRLAPSHVHVSILRNGKFAPNTGDHFDEFLCDQDSPALGVIDDVLDLWRGQPKHDGNGDLSSPCSGRVNLHPFHGVKGYDSKPIALANPHVCQRIGQAVRPFIPLLEGVSLEFVRDGLLGWMMHRLNLDHFTHRQPLADRHDLHPSFSARSGSILANLLCFVKPTPSSARRQEYSLFKERKISPGFTVFRRVLYGLVSHSG